jgi:hypothetical protein
MTYVITLTGKQKHTYKYTVTTSLLVRYDSIEYGNSEAVPQSGQSNHSSCKLIGGHYSSCFGVVFTAVDTLCIEELHRMRVLT